MHDPNTKFKKKINVKTILTKFLFIVMAITERKKKKEKRKKEKRKKK
jgi:hypothetical protein